MNGTCSPHTKNLLQRLQELKQWQESHENLLRGHQFNSDDSNLNNTSDYKTIDGLSEFDSVCSPPKRRIDPETPIKPTAKSFEELLEENLSSCNNSATGGKTVPKKPFLRKGTGLVRYRLSPKTSSKNVVPRKQLERSFTPLTTPQGSISNKAVWQKVDDSRPDQSQEHAQYEPSEQSLYERALEKELRIFEALEEKVHNSSFSSTSSSVLNLLHGSPRKEILEKHPSIPEEKHVHWQQSDEGVIHSNLEERELVNIFNRLKNFATNTATPQSSVSSDREDDEESDRSSTATSSVSSSLFSASDTEKERKEVAVSTAEEPAPSSGDLLHKRITEYDMKIKNVIEERDKIQKTRRQLELKEKALLKRISEFEDKERNFLMELENDRKKLAKEKVEFQMYVRETQSAPTRKDREEVANLKREVAELRESLKLRESKNGMSQARLRNQIKQLEKDNTNLKGEVEKLMKENAKLSAAQKLNTRRPKQDSKILREINRNITKLASKENDCGDVSSPNNSKNDSQNDCSLLELYKRITPSKDADLLTQNVSSNSLNDSNRVEQVLIDGSKEIKYGNGNVKTVSPDGNFVTVKYFNGDIKQTFLLDGVVKYFYQDRNTWQTSYPNGEELIEFADGTKEKRFKDGKCEITLPNNVMQTLMPDGTQQIKYPDGSILTIKKDGDKILMLPNGQVEIETNDHRRREYPDGTVKIIHNDGKQETRYSNGRIRIRDETGALILDTHKDD